MPWYRKEGKILEPLTHTDFLEGMKAGHFTHESHKGYVALLYYSGVRRAEALRSKPGQFSLGKEFLYFDVGPRLKRGRHTPPLPINLEADYVGHIKNCVLQTRHKRRVWPFCPKTAYNAVARVFKYPHHLRLSRITNFFLEGYDIARVRNWTGLTMKSLDFYIGLADLRRMGKSLT